MPLVALGLIIIAAFAHASWNLLAKHAADCKHFNWFYSVGSCVLFAPLAAFFLITAPPTFSALTMAILTTTGILHIAYSDVLQRGYRAADISVVYPVARGTGPLLAFVGALVFLREKPSVTAAVGMVLVVSGVFLIAGGPRIFKVKGSRAGLAWGFATGALIASYTLVDGYAVKFLLIAPPLVDYCGNLFRCVLLLPRALNDQARVRKEWRRWWRPAMGVAILGPSAYILILYAVTLAPVSHVAPAREISMMIGAYFGARIFGEEARRARIVSAGLIVAGVLALTLG